LTIKKFWGDGFLQLFGIYGFAAAFLNTLDLFKIPYSFIEKINVLYNILDIPFVILILFQVTRSSLGKQMMKGSMIIYLVLQVASIVKYGLSYESIKYSLGYGIVMIIMFSGYLLSTYVRRMKLAKLHIAHMILLGSILFNYGSFVVIYIFDFYVENYNMADNLMLYYISSCISMAMVTAGLLVPAKLEISDNS
jgi:hypothetical protein